MLIRNPAVAGRFYTDDPENLRQELRGYLDKSADYLTECAGRPAIGCMVPHAGYVFSGMVAGLTLGQIAVPAKVLVLAPSHTGYGPQLSLWPEGVWRTPLGDVPVDSKGVDFLVNYTDEAGKSGLFEKDTTAHLKDHAIEVVLPFLQAINPDIEIIPLCVRLYNPDALRQAGLALAALVKKYQKAGENLLLLTSSDMSHYLPHDEGKKQDRLALEKIQKLDPSGLFNVCAINKISMCGFAPMALMLFACNGLGATRCCLAAHTSSGITGQAFGASMDSVVGYAGAIIS